MVTTPAASGRMMGDCVTLCEECGAVIGGMENAHLVHEDCDRFLGLECRCDKWVCLVCCPERECTPLQESLREARERDRAGKDAWEAAQTVPASTEGSSVPAVAHPLSGFYFGGVG